MNTNPSYVEQRLKDLRETANRAYKDLLARGISEKQFNEVMARVETEAEDCRIARKTRNKALSYASCGDSLQHYRATAAPERGVIAKNLSPADIPHPELVNMFEAAKHRQPYRIEVTKSFSDGGVTTKATGSPIAEGAPWPGGLLPPVLRPELTQELRYEPDRLADHLPTITIEAPSIEYLVHTGNTNPAAVVEELGVKPDLGMQLDTQTAVPIKLAALASVSMEALKDFSYFVSWVPRELTRAVTNTETQQLVLGTGESGDYPGMVGFVNTPNVLTRSFEPGNDISGLDTLIRSVNDIRVGPAFGQANLIALHPTTWDFLKRTKTTTDAFALAIMDPGSIGRLDNLFGTRVITNSFIPEGTGVVLDTELAARYFVRQSLTLDMNPWGDTQWTTNQISFRAEMRSVLAVLRPTAVCIVSGLGPL
ncbi:MAG: phage major capsid protein, partial [Mycobacterium sp.]|nr:phage major capsid protein [Mycobacterium sp.]